MLTAAATNAIGAPRTEQSVYTPFAIDGALRAGLKVLSKEGECFTTSLVISRPGVFRCITGNLLRDPCFRDPTVDEDEYFPVVLCASGPWRRTLIRIPLSEELPEDAAARHGQPWALELSDGSRCLFLTGATTVVRGYRLNYSCSRTRFLFGSPRRTDPTWRIRLSSTPEGDRMRLVRIRRAWR